MFKHEAFASAALTLSGSISRTFEKFFKAFSILFFYINAFPLENSAKILKGSLFKMNSESLIALSNSPDFKYFWSLFW